jgi:hypothetical protein
MNAVKVTSPLLLAVAIAPLGLATFFAGLVIGLDSVTPVASANWGCGSPFFPRMGYLSTDAQAACAPLIYERDSWATTLFFVGLGLLGSAGMLLLSLTVAPNFKSLINPTFTIHPPSLSGSPPSQPPAYPSPQQPWPPQSASLPPTYPYPH